MQHLRVLTAAGLIALIGACATGQKEVSVPQSFSFPVIGDIPYNDDDREVLEGDIVPLIKAGGFPFVIHVGDYKSGGAACSPEEDAAQLALIETLAPAPMFYTPGDNEWTDCDRFKDDETGKPASELARLDKLRELFFSQALEAPKALHAITQSDAPENAMWRYGGVRFATVLVVGTGNGRRAVAGDDPEQAGRLADIREAAARNWITAASIAAQNEKARALVIAIHGDMTDVDAAVLGKPCDGAIAGQEQICDAFVDLRASARKAAESFNGPVLLIHGDTAPFRLGQAFAGDEAGNLWILNAAGDHGVTPEGFHYGVQDSTLVTFNPDDATPFSAKGVATGALAETD